MHVLFSRGLNFNTVVNMFILVANIYIFIDSMYRPITVASTYILVPSIFFIHGVRKIHFSQINSTPSRFVCHVLFMDAHIFSRNLLQSSSLEKSSQFMQTLAIFSLARMLGIILFKAVDVTSRPFNIPLSAFEVFQLSQLTAKS